VGDLLTSWELITFPKTALLLEVYQLMRQRFTTGVAETAH
jgi:hypothetical protein